MITIKSETYREMADQLETAGAELRLGDGYLDNLEVGLML